MDQKTIHRLTSILDSSKFRRQYQLARYCDDITVSLDNTMDYASATSPLNGFAQPQTEGFSKPGSFNVIRSCIDSLVSKISANKVRPYIHPLNGTYITKQVTRQVRQFFDVILDKYEVSNKVMQAFRLACIFDTGYLFINPFTYELQVLPPFTVGMLGMERAYGKNRELVVKFNNYPTTLLTKEEKKKSETYNKDYVQLVYTVSCVDKKAEKYIDTKLIESIDYKAENLPIVPLYYSTPVFGNKTFSLADALEGIQEQIDLISAKIAASAEVTSTNTTYVVEGSSLNAGQLDGRVGNVYTIKMPEGSSSLPVMNVNPPVLDPSWQNLLTDYINKAYEITGISQLSAQSKKPAGLDSGAALATMEDIESERFQTQLDNYISSYKKLAELICEIMPDDLDIIPENSVSSSYKWKDIRKEMKSLRINFAADDILSKDPAMKLKQISQISQIGGIDINELTEQLDSSDLENAYANMGAKINAIERTIENAIEEGIYIIPPFVSYQDLYKKILTTESQLFASFNSNNSDKVLTSLLRVQILEGILDEVINNNGYLEDETTEAQTAEASGLTNTGSASTSINTGLN